MKFRQTRIAKGKFQHWHYWGYVDGTKRHFVGPLPSTTGGDSFESINHRDKNNKEIYEGDQVKARYIDLLDVEREVIGVVEIQNLQVVLDFPNEGITVPMVHFWTDEPDDFEILGNEWETPELKDNQCTT